MTGTRERLADRLATRILAWPKIVRVLSAVVLVALLMAAVNAAVFPYDYADWVITVETAVASLVVVWMTSRSWVPRVTRPGPWVMLAQAAAVAAPIVAAARVRPIWLVALAGSALVVAFLGLYAPLPLAHGHRTRRKVRARAT